jgi:hypothetical protein
MRRDPTTSSLRFPLTRRPIGSRLISVTAASSTPKAMTFIGFSACGAGALGGAGVGCAAVGGIVTQKPPEGLVSGGSGMSGCGGLQPSQIAAPDSGVRDAKIFFDTGSEPANQSHFKRQKRRPAGYGSSAYGGVSKAWLQIPKIEPVLVTVEVRRLLLDLPPCNNVSPVGPWWVQFGPQLGDAFRSCPENACPAGSWILRKVVRTASPLSVVLLQTRFRRH